MAAETQKLLGYLLRLTDQATSDAALLGRWAEQKDENAFAALVARHGPMVLGVCRRVLSDRQHAEDAFQATFLVLARKAATLQRPEALPGFLYGVALRLARKARATRRCRSVPTQSDAPEPADPQPHALDALSGRELLAMVDAEVARLPEVYRLPVLLCVLQERSVEEAARILGWTTGLVRSRLARGRQRLRQRLTDGGLASSGGVLTLLSPGKVPPHLLAASLRNLTSAAPATVSALAAGANLVLGIKVLCVALVLAAVGLGAGLPLLRAPELAEPVVAAPPAPVKENLHCDLYGDLLPAEAIARLGTVRLRHGASPRALAFAPDGRSLASAGIDGTVHIWATATGKELLRIENKRFEAGLGAVFGLAYSPDGKTLAGARLNQQACLWDVATGKELRQFGGTGHRAGWVIFSPDGKTLAYGGVYRDVNAMNRGDPFVRLADVNTGKDLHQFGGHKGFVTRVAFSPDGTMLASADDETIHLIHIGTGQSRVLLHGNDAALHVSALTFSPDGKKLAAASEVARNIRLIDVPTGKTTHTMKFTSKQEDVVPIVFTPDGKTVISGHLDGFVRFWDTGSGRITHRFRAHWQDIMALVISRDGQILATSSNSGQGDNTVRLWETDAAKPLVRYPGPQQGIWHVVFSPDSKWVATSSGEGAVHLWEAVTGKLLHHWDLPASRLTFLLDGHTLVCGGRDGRVHCLDVTTGKETRQWRAHAQAISAMSLARDGKTLATAGYEGFFRLWHLPTGRLLRDFGGQLKQTNYVCALALSPDARLLVSAHTDKTMHLWETSTGRLLREDHESVVADDVSSLDFSPDGRLLALPFRNDIHHPLTMMQLREPTTGKVVHQFEGGGQGVAAPTFSPDGRCLICGGMSSKEVYYWEIATGSLRRRFAGHEGYITCLAFSPNGHMIASGSSDASVLIWDVTGHGERQRAPAARLSRAALDQLWTELAASDAATAYRALCVLSAAPQQAVLLLEQHVKPVPLADPKRLADAVRNLDSDQFTVRDDAANQLRQFAEAAEPALRQALAAIPSEEVRRRVEKLLDLLLGAEQWRRSRALEVLEHIAGPEARRVLTGLAHGAPQASLTREAQASLDRLNRRTAALP